MEINITNPKEVVVVPEQKKTINKITIQRMVDLPVRKKVLVITEELGQIVLWEDVQYDSIGQWTDTQVIERIQELYSA
jgi:hypothetical protein